MMRRRHLMLILGILGLLVVATGGSAIASSASVKIRSVDQHAFPTVTLTVSVTGVSAVAPSDIRITENGVVRPVQSVRTLEESGRRIDIVLAIDTSNSVKGAPLAAAVTAAKTLIGQLPASVQVGVLTFAATPLIAQPVTSDHQAALTVLDSLTVSAGTAVFDGVRTAAGMFSGDAQHNIVLLTDGTDTTGATLQSAVAAAKAAPAAVFSVGLMSSALDESVLQNLSTQTAGAYAPATEANLGQVYQQLGTELSHQYEVTYQSGSPLGSQVTIGASVHDATDTSLILTPAAPPANPLTAHPHHSLIHGTWGVAVAAGLTFLALFILLVMVLGAGSRVARQRDLAKRVVYNRGYDTSEGVPHRPDAGMAGWIPQPVVSAAQAVADAGGFSTGLEARLERAGFPIKSGEFVAAAAGAGVLGVAIGWLVFNSWLFALILAGVGAAIPRIVLGVSGNRRRDQLQAQLADVVNILASSLRAGHSFIQALDMASKEVGEPAGPEFQRVVAEIRLGRPMEEALNAMAERVGSDDFKWAVLAVNVQREVGGNLAEILDTVAKTVREREVLRRQVKVLSAEGRLSVKILVALPFLVGLYVSKVNPGYMSLLFTTRLGLVLLGTGIVLLLVGIFWARKVVDVDV
jgi:tight adherence protein B